MPARDPRAALEGDEDADWIVIGAGFAGQRAVRHLTVLHPTDQIGLLEASRVGAGPARRNSGCLIDLPHDLTSEAYGGAIDRDRAQIAANRHAMDLARRMASALCAVFSLAWWRQRLPLANPPTL
ncbi:MAG: hypothetical protein AAGF78_08110 [Pseudomonadota bacterium]